MDIATTLATEPEAGQAPAALATKRDRIRAEVVTVTPELAEKWLAENFKKQREPVKGNMVRLRAALKANEFETTGIKFYTFNGKRYLVDGQHRLNAIVETGVAVVLVVIWEEAEDYEQIVHAYERIDNGELRKPIDAVKAAELHNTVGISLTEARKLISALKILSVGIQGKTGAYSGGRFPGEIACRGVSQWGEEARKFFRATDAAITVNKRAICQAPILTVGLVTFRYEDAIKSKFGVEPVNFWRQAAEQDGVEAKTGPWWAAQIAREKPVEKGDKRNDVGYLARQIAKAWELYCRRGKQDLFHNPDTLRPIHIAGTPYNGKTIIREEF